jgi:phosphoglycerate kinase
VSGPAAENAFRSAPDNGVVLLENLRFHPEEEKNDAGFAKQLAALADVYVNDAFGAAHRAHASVEALVRLIPEAGAGLLMDTELRYLGEALSDPARPFVAVLGGAKVSDKIEVIENLIPRLDRLLIGGAWPNVFQGAQGSACGHVARRGRQARRPRMTSSRAPGQRGLQLLLPVDHVVAPKLEAGVPVETLGVGDPAIGDRMGLDMGRPRLASTRRH